MIDMFLNVAPAVQVIFELGIEPKEEDFYELTESQYELFSQQGGLRPPGVGNISRYK